MNQQGIDLVTYDEYLKMQFKIGLVLECTEIKKSKNLLCLKVSLGSYTKQILCGIKNFYKPEELIGKKVVVLDNAQPVTMAGMVSEGILLSAEDKEGRLAVLVPERDVDVNAEIY